MKAEGMPSEKPGCGGWVLAVVSAVVLGLVLLCWSLAVQGVAAGHGPWPDPTLTPPARTATP